MNYQIDIQTKMGIMNLKTVGGLQNWNRFATEVILFGLNIMEERWLLHYGQKS